jgi:hypothetical protein
MVDWEREQFTPMLIEYNDLMAKPYAEHIADFNFTEIRLDCVVAQTHVEEWRDSVLPAPEAVLEALTADLLSTLGEAFELCLEAETFGEWRTVADRFVELNLTVQRVYEHVRDSE